MKPQWILIANASTASLLARAAPDQPLQMLAGFQHPASRLRGVELAHDRPGHEAADHSTASARFEPRGDVRRRQHEQFAAELAARLEQGLADGRYGELWLLASNPFLGEIKAKLSDRVVRQIKLVHARDFTAFNLHELEQRLRDPKLLGS